MKVRQKQRQKSPGILTGNKQGQMEKLRKVHLNEIIYRLLWNMSCTMK